MKVILIVLSTTLAVSTAIISLSILLCPDFDFSPHDGPFPSTLPAGCCLMTDGERFEVRQMRVAPSGHKYHGFLTGENPSERIAIEWSWIMIEHQRKKRSEPKREPLPMRPVYPELCNTPSK